MFLTDAELCEFTGYQKPAGIKRWLDERGYKYEVARNGWPRVLRAAVEEKLGLAAKPAKQEPKINFS